nr:hypothetical protein [Actinomycetota bacterium]
VSDCFVGGVRGEGRHVSAGNGPLRWGRPAALPPGGLALTALVMASMRAMAGLMIALVIFGFRRQGAPLVWYGLVGVASVGGNLGGAALAPVVRDRVHEERIVTVAAVAIGLMALAMTQLTWLHRRPAALVVGFTVGFFASVAKLAFDAVVQRDAPSGSRSRLFARLEAVFQLAWVLAALIPVVIPMSLLDGFVLVGVATLGSTLMFVVGLARARRGALPGWWPGVADSHATGPPLPAIGGAIGAAPLSATGLVSRSGGRRLPPPPAGPLPPEPLPPQ